MVDQIKTVWWRGALRRLITVTFTLLVVAGSAAAVVFGSNFLADRAEATDTVSEAAPTLVETTELTVTDGYDVPRQFVGQVEAAASSVLSFERAGRLSQITVDEGSEVTKGTVLATLDTALLEAEETRLTASKAAITAQLDLAETRLTRAQSLLAGGHVSQETVDQALATRDELASRIQETNAALETVAINLEKSELIAPFDGRVGSRNVDGGETLGAGSPVLTLIETTAPQVRVGLPLSVDASQYDTLAITIAGTEYPANLTQIRPDIDPVTRTRTALFTLQTTDTPAFGQTATLTLPTYVQATGTWVPLDALQEGAGGGWTIMVVEDDTVRVALVETLHADETRAYVTGTFTSDTRMISTGAHRVVPGQAVQILTAQR